jgi:hypothetical protein
MATIHDWFPAEFLEIAARMVSVIQGDVLVVPRRHNLLEFLTSARSDEASVISPSAPEKVVVLDNALLDKTAIRSAHNRKPQRAIGKEITRKNGTVSAGYEFEGPKNGSITSHETITRSSSR